jgi:CubicO group peptidase (beta-lactamase class C family)
MGAGLSKIRLARLHDLMAAPVDRGDLPGVVTLIRRRGEVHVDTLGTLALGGEARMQRDSIFRIASISKPITAVAAMILIEECVLRLDDPVDELLPELADRRVLKRLDGPLEETVVAERSITVRDLLTFRLGFGIIMAPPGAYPIQRALEPLMLGQSGPPEPQTLPAPDEWMRRFSGLPLLDQPGRRWMYNTGSDLLSVLIARASDQPFETFLRERVFEPLGMKDTGFSVPAKEIHRLATQYAPDPDTGSPALYDPAEGGQWAQPPAFPSGAGGLVSTADDLAAFAAMMLAKGRVGGERLLSRLSVEAMTTDQLTPAQRALGGMMPGDFDALGWGFGLSVATRRDGIAAVPGRFGWDGGLGTSWYSDPVEGLTGILLTQLGWTSPVGPHLRHDFWTAAYAAIDD